MTNDNDADDRHIDVKATDEDTSIPDALRALADRLEEDDDRQLMVGVVGVDEHDRHGGGIASYALHFKGDRIDELGANETLNATQRFNEALVKNALDVGLGDAVAKANNPLSGAEVVGGGAIDLSGMFGGGPDDQ